MTEKKYELLKDDTVETPDGKTLYRIRALRDIGEFAKAGDLGGYVASEQSLSHEANAWVSGYARVYGDAQVSDDAHVSGYAWVSDDAQVLGDAWVSDDAQVSGNAWVSGDAQVSGNAHVSGYAQVLGDAQVSGNARVSGNALVSGNADILWFSHVGSEHGTLTCYRGKDDQILVTRGYFSGTEEEFLAAVEKKHGTSRIGHEYRLLIEVARSRLNPQGE